MYSLDIDTAMERETNMKNRTVNRWEKDIKGKILEKARKHIGKKKVNKNGKKVERMVGCRGHGSYSSKKRGK